MVEVAALQIGAGQHGIAHRHLAAFVGLVETGEIGHRPAVGRHITVETPLAAQNVDKQGVVAATGLPVEAVVGTHHAMHLGLGHQFAESGQISVPKVVGRRPGIKFMTFGLRPAVHGKMLGTGHGLEIMRVVALQSADNGRPHLSRQIGVLAIGFLPPAPSRVAEDVDIGRPVSQPVILRNALAVAESFVEKRTPLGSGNVAHALQRLRIESGSHADGLGKHRHLFLRTGHSVQRLVPPVVGRNAQPGHGDGGMLHHAHLFRKREPRNEVAHPLFQRQVGVAEGQKFTGRRR